ncbi:MAG: hypothetical protein ABI151_17780 [Chitinophagaceae bacterium]
MNEEKRSLSRTEIFSGCLVIFVGIFYLMSLVGPFFQAKEAVSRTLFTIQQAKMLLYVLLYLGGGMLLLGFRKPGWVITTASLMNIVCITFYFVVGLLQTGLNIYQLIPFLFLTLAIMALYFMFRKEVRINQRVNNLDYLFTVVIYLVLLFITARL